MSDATIGVYGEHEGEQFSLFTKLMNLHTYLSRKLVFYTFSITLYTVNKVSHAVGFRFDYEFKEDPRWVWQPFAWLKRPVLEWKD